MAKVRQRTWTIPGQRTKRKAWGFVTVDNGKQVRQFKAEWTREDAENALAAHVLKVEQPKAPAPGLTLAQAAERYLAAKTRKRSVTGDRRILDHFKAEFGENTPLTDITAGRISEYRAKRLIQRGATLPELKDLLGHSSLAMVMRYAHLSPEHLRSAVARLDTVLTPQKITQAITHEPAVETTKGSR